MKQPWRSLLLGLLVTAAGRSAHSQAISVTRLTPSTTPSAAIGNDMLLVENARAGGMTQPLPGSPAHSYPACSWTVDLRMGEGNISTGISSGEVDMNGFWTGSGPTGTFSGGTIGTGKRTENTLGDIHTAGWRPTGQIVIYQYVFHVTNYNSTTGVLEPTDKYIPYYSYSS